MLDLWSESYFEVRARIEASGRDSRWEFDRKRLFERTDYMALICQDFYDVAQVLEEFHNIFGPELKVRYERRMKLLSLDGMIELC